jgi:hypothetical protein
VEQEHEHGIEIATIQPRNMVVQTVLVTTAKQAHANRVLVEVRIYSNSEIEVLTNKNHNFKYASYDMPTLLRAGQRG